jgi:hypothetical protein
MSAMMDLVANQTVVDEVANVVSDKAAAVVADIG